MSYCRWSSDNWKCDLYCYEDVYGGYTTHVAGNRIIGEVPTMRFLDETISVVEKVVDRLTDKRATEFAKSYQEQMKFLDTCKREPIGLPYDDERFNDPDLESFLARLLQLRETGYRFPDYVLEEVRHEIEIVKGGK